MCFALRPSLSPAEPQGRPPQAQITLIIYTWVFDTWFWDRPEVVDLWGLGGPGGPKPFQKVGGEALHLLEWL